MADWERVRSTYAVDGTDVIASKCAARGSRQLASTWFPKPFSVCVAIAPPFNIPMPPQTTFLIYQTHLSVQKLHQRLSSHHHRRNSSCSRPLPPPAGAFAGCFGLLRRPVSTPSTSLSKVLPSTCSRSPPQRRFGPDLTVSSLLPRPAYRRSVNGRPHPRITPEVMEEEGSQVMDLRLGTPTAPNTTGSQPAGRSTHSSSPCSTQSPDTSGAQRCSIQLPQQPAER